MKRISPEARSTDDRFAHLFAASPAGILIVRSDGSLVAANSAASDLLGYTRQGLVDTHLSQLGTESEDVENILCAVVHEATDVSVEAELRRKDGQRIICTLTGSCREENGEQQIYLFLEDITERKALQRDLDQSKELYRAVLNSLSEAILVTREDGTLTYVSPNAHVVFGYSAEEIMQRGNISELLSENFVSQFRAELSSKAELQNLQCRIRDSEERIVDLLVCGRKVTIGEGKILYSCRDISELKEVERALRESERKFRQLAEQSILGICLVQDGVFRYVNPRVAEMFGYTPDKLVDRRGPADLVKPSGRSRLEEKIGRCLRDEDGEIMTYQLEGVRSDGETIHVEIHGTRIYSRGAPALLSYVLDVTDRRRLERALLHVQEEERKRIGQELHDTVASHLTGLSLIVSSYIQGLEKDESVGREALERIDAMLKKGEEQARKISHGLHPAALTDGTLPEALHELAESLSLQFDGDSTYTGRLETPSIDVERATHLYRIAQEAGTNAVRHAEASTITIDCELERNTVVMSVLDDGEGFHLDRQSEGIGMQSMRYRAELIGAELDIRSEIGEGTRVECRLPIEP